MRGTLATWSPQKVWLYAYGPLILSYPGSVALGVAFGMFPIWWGIACCAVINTALWFTVGRVWHEDARRRFGDGR